MDVEYIYTNKNRGGVRVKLRFDGYEIDIKVKKGASEKYNKQDTLYFLNWLCMLSNRAVVGYDVDNLKTYASLSGEFASYLYGVCIENGLYGVSRETEEGA